MRNDLDRALEWYKKALVVDPDFGDAYYNMACVYALQGQKELALRYLQIAALNGYASAEGIDADPDLGRCAAIRPTTRWSGPGCERRAAMESGSPATSSRRSSVAGGWRTCTARAPLAGPRAGQIVALKRLRPELARDPQYLDLFHREAAVTCRLDHPTCIEVLETGVAGGAPVHRDGVRRRPEPAARS